MHELSALTCLIILLYDAPTAVACRPDDHAEIVAAIASKDPEIAAEIAVRHLDEIERSVKFEMMDEEVDLDAIFS